MEKVLIWKDTNSNIIKIAITTILVLFGISGYYNAGYGVLFFIVPMILYWLLLTPHFSPVKIYRDGIIIAESRLLSIRRKFLKWEKIMHLDVSWEKTEGESFFRDKYSRFIRIKDLSGNKYRNILFMEDKFKEVIPMLVKERKLTKLDKKPSWLKN